MKITFLRETKILQFVQRFLYTGISRARLRVAVADCRTKAIPELRRYDEYGVVSCTQGYLLHGKTSLYLRAEPPPPATGDFFWHGAACRISKNRDARS